jgi:hypothetical protein
MSLGIHQTYANSTYGNYLRGEANLITPLAEKLAFRIGINAMKFTGRSSTDDLNTGFGFQTGLGYELSEHWGLRTAYIEMHSAGSVPVTATSSGQVIGHIDVEYKLSGIELAATYSF